MSQDRIPKNVHFLLEHCLMYGFAEMAEELYQQKKESDELPVMWEDYASRGIWESPSLLFARKPGYMDLCEPPPLSTDKVDRAFCLALRWLTVASGPRRLKCLTEDLESLTNKEILDIVGYALYVCREDEDRDATECKDEKLLSFEDVVVCILVGQNEERERALALRGRSLHGGPLRYEPGVASYNRCQVGDYELRDLQLDAVHNRLSSCPVRINYKFYLRSPKHLCQRCCIGDWRKSHRRWQRELLPEAQSDAAKVVFIDWADQEESYNLMYNVCCNSEWKQKNRFALRLVAHGYVPRWKNELLILLCQLHDVLEIVLPDVRYDWDVCCHMAGIIQELDHAELRDILFEDGQMMCALRYMTFEPQHQWESEQSYLTQIPYDSDVPMDS